jgi:hypothetical protein
LHSHAIKTCQPSRLSWRIFFRSRCLFLSNFGLQKSSRDFGKRASLQRGSEWRCQKQPCINITFFKLGNTKSGMPGRLRRCNRYLNPMRCTRRRTNNSGFVSLPRMRLIRLLRCLGVSVSAMVSLT